MVIYSIVSMCFGKIYLLIFEEIIMGSVYFEDN